MSTTKRKSLEICRDGWKKLADNPDLLKWHVEEFKEMRNWCPCCEYAGGGGERRSLDCTSCPLLGYAWGMEEDSNKSNYCHCLDISSPYYKWEREDTNPALRAKYSREIYEASLKALAALDAEEAVDPFYTPKTGYNAETTRETIRKEYKAGATHDPS